MSLCVAEPFLRPAETRLADAANNAGDCDDNSDRLLRVVLVPGARLRMSSHSTPAVDLCILYSFPVAAIEKKSPQTWRLKQHIYYLTVLKVRSTKSVSEGSSQVSAGQVLLQAAGETLFPCAQRRPAFCGSEPLLCISSVSLFKICFY